MESTFIITTDCLKKTHRSAYLAKIMVQLTMAYDSSTITVPQLDHTIIYSRFPEYNIYCIYLYNL